MPDTILRRPRLNARLACHPPPVLTAVIAPAGYGKSVLLADWARSLPDTAVAWVTLDDRDADAQLWPAIAAALGAVLGDGHPLGRTAHAWIGRDLGVHGHLRFIDEAVEASAASPMPVVLVLDDVHRLTAGAQQGLIGLLRSWQTEIRLVLAGRSEPHLPLARLRLQGRLCEIREDDLRFTADEGARLLALAGLPPDQADDICARTGGWAAGLRLAAQHLHRNGDPNRLLTMFSGRDDAVAEYLAVEILAELEDEECNVLRRASIVNPLPAELASELCGRDDAAEMLERLGRKTGLLSLTESAGAEYRTQELLRSYLATDLSRRSSRLVSVLHGQAAVWFDARDRPAEALWHASASGNAELLHGLLGRRAAELAASGEHEILDEIVHENAVDPWLLLGRALVDLGRGNARGVTTALHGVRRLGPTTGELGAFRDAVEQLCGAPGHRPPAPAPADPVLAAVSRAGRATACRDRTDIESALELAQHQGLTFLDVHCRCLLAIAHWFAGDLPRACVQASAGVAAATSHGWRSSPWVNAAGAVLAYAQLLQCRPESALALVRAGLEAPTLPPVVRFVLSSVHGAASADLGRPAAGVEEMRRARVQAASTAMPSALAVAAASFEHDAALRIGFHNIADAAHRILVENAAHAEVALADARFGLLRGDPESARAVIAPVLAGTCDAPVLAHTVVDAWVVEANCAFAAGNRLRARHAVRIATACAEGLDAVRPFRHLDEGPTGYLVDILGRTDDTASFAARALAGRMPEATRTPTALSAREHEVLIRLQEPTSLIEIAHDLGVSVNTVKTHLRAIYTKLGVASRRAAVVAAHNRRLM